MNKAGAVLFDVDGVLLDSAEANVVFYQELFQQAGLPVPTETELAAQNQLSVPDMIRKIHPELSAELLAKMVSLGDTITVGYGHLHLAPGTIEVVTKLAEHYQLGVVTNRSRIGVEELWRFSGLGQYFSAVAAYEDTPNHKPDPEPVRYVLDKLGVRPDQAVFIGDALTDLTAAQAAGTKFIMYGITPAPAGTPVATRFDELPDLILGLLPPR